MWMDGPSEEKTRLAEFSEKLFEGFSDTFHCQETILDWLFVFFRLLGGVLWMPLGFIDGIFTTRWFR